MRKKLTLKIILGPIYTINLNMKTKLLYITILLLLQGNLLFSQCISIELSIIWERGYDVFKIDSIASIPKLNITYRNNCDINYYFKRLCVVEDSLPNIACYMTCPPDYQKYKTIEDFIEHNIYNNGYINQNFRVEIKENIYYSKGGWRVHSDFDDRLDKEIANCNIRDLYRFTQHHNKSKELFINRQQKPVKFRFESKDMHQDSLLIYFEDQFLFIKSNEIFVDTYNLFAFQIVEGCYTFYIGQEDIKNYVQSSETIITEKYFDDFLNRETNTKIIYPKHILPSVVGEYHLYSGAFNTNKVTVCFGEQSDDRNLEYLKCIQNQENQMDNVEKQEKKKEKRK